MLRFRTLVAGFLFVAVLAAPDSSFGRGQRKAPAPQSSLDSGFINKLVENQQAALKALESYCYSQSYLYEKLSESDEVQRRDQRTEVLCQEEGGLRSRALTISGLPTGAREDDPWPPLVKDASWERQKAALAERNARWQELVSEVPRATIFTRLRDEVMDGRQTTLFHLAPDSRYRPRSRITELLAHVGGQAWIDMQAVEMVKLAVVVDSDFNLWGGLALKVRKGGGYEMRQRPVNGVWMPWYQDERWHARIALIMNTGQHQRIERSNFRLASIVMGRQTVIQTKEK